MARFGQGFLNALTQPSYGQGLFELGGAIGGAPAAAKEREAREGMLAQLQSAMLSDDPIVVENASKAILKTDPKAALQLAQRAKTLRADQSRLSRLNESTGITAQGTAAAQQGDVSALTQRIQELQTKSSQASTLEEKQDYIRQIQSLQGLLPNARQAQTQNKAKGIINAEKALESGELAPAAAEAIKNRLAEMKQDPEAVEQYNAYKLNEWRTDQARQQMEAEAWLNSNGSKIAQAVSSADLDAIEQLGQQASQQNVYTQFQQYVATATQNQKTRDYLEQRSTERTSKPNLNYQDAIDGLPEELRSMVQSKYDVYKAVAESGWNGTEWQTGARIRAVKLEETLKDSLDRAQQTAALTDFRNASALETATAELVQKLELSLEVPINDLEISRRAELLADNPKKIKESDINKAREQLQQERVNSVLSQIRIIDPKYAEEKYPERKIDPEALAQYSEEDQQTIRAYASAYTDRDLDEIIQALKKKGRIGVQNSKDGAFGTSYMSSEHVAPAQRDVERVRSKISPLGTYTQG